MTPLQAELLEDGIVPEPDEIARTLLRPDLAPEAGYVDGGPDPLRGPGGPSREDLEAPRWRGEPRVFQWEIDPTDPRLPEGEAEVVRDGWAFWMWWKIHDTGLVYASIQASEEDIRTPPGGRPHAVGRSVVVNLVYDTVRRGVAAIYGTARDFRPFVEAFREAYGLGAPPAPSGAREGPTSEATETSAAARRPGPDPRGGAEEPRPESAASPTQNIQEEPQP